MPGWSLTVHLFWIPTLALVFRLLYRGRHPFMAALLAYSLGGVAILAALFMQAAWNISLPENQIMTLLELPLWSAPVEEWAKLLAAVVTARVVSPDRPSRDFVAISVAASLGFAGGETVLFVMEKGADVLPLRVLISMPAHVSFTLLAAIGLAGGRSPRETRRLFWSWWALASLAHTAYNAPLLLDPETSPLYPLAATLLFFGLALLFAWLRLKRSKPQEPQE